MTEASVTSKAPTAGGAPKSDYTRRALMVLGITVALAALLLFIDGPIAHFSRRLQQGGDLRLGGDVRRTLEFLQQFGDVASSVIAGLCIVLLDPPMRRRMLDWIVGALATWLTVWLTKVTVGRPRPRIVFESPKAGFDGVVQFTPPWVTYPLPRTDGSGVVTYLERHAWEFWAGISSDLWSMPSSHTSSAAALAVGLATMYPRLKPLVWALVFIVGISRVITGAHFPADVMLGAGVGYCVTTLAMGGQWGQRLFKRPAGG